MSIGYLCFTSYLVLHLNGISFKCALPVSKGFKSLHGLLSNINIRIRIKKQIRGLPLPPALWPFWVEKGVNFKSCPRVSKHEAQSNKNMRIPHPKKNWGPPYSPHYAIIGRKKGGISKSCPRVPKLRI